MLYTPCISTRVKGSIRVHYKGSIRVRGSIRVNYKGSIRVRVKVGVEGKFDFSSVGFMI